MWNFYLEPSIIQCGTFGAEPPEAVLASETGQTVREKGLKPLRTWNLYVEPLSATFDVEPCVEPHVPNSGAGFGPAAPFLEALLGNMPGSSSCRAMTKAASAPMQKERLPETFQIRSSGLSNKRNDWSISAHLRLASQGPCLTTL